LFTLREARQDRSGYNRSYALAEVAPDQRHVNAPVTKASFNGSSREWSATHIDLEIQLLRLVQLTLAGAEIVTQRSEEVRNQGSGLMSIGGIRLAELGAHPLFLHAELDPEHQEDENENDEPAHLGD
jgi:hypothetical protein